MSQPDLPPDVHLIVRNTPFGVVISHTGPLADHDNEAAFVARSMCVFTGGLFAGGQTVILSQTTHKECQ